MSAVEHFAPFALPLILVALRGFGVVDADAFSIYAFVLLMSHQIETKNYMRSAR